MVFIRRRERENIEDANKLNVFALNHAYAFSLAFETCLLECLHFLLVEWK
jgi:hypothetical protein